MRAKVIFAVTLIIVGLILILAVPTVYLRSPLLVYITEQHAIRLVDTIGLAMAVPSWLYLNVLVVRLWAKRRKRGNSIDNDKQ